MDANKYDIVSPLNSKYPGKTNDPYNENVQHYIDTLSGYIAADHHAP